MATAPAQHLEALREANRIRRCRAEIKRELHTARSRAVAWQEAARLLEDPPEELLGMRLSDLLRACRRTGPSTVRRLLRAVGASELRRIGDLTVRQRDAVASVLRRGWC